MFIATKRPRSKDAIYQDKYRALNPEKVAAKTAVRRAVKSAQLPRPASLSCSDCGAVAREYDHHKGYDPTNWLVVEPVCRPCHYQRGLAQGYIRLRELEHGTLHGYGRRGCRCRLCRDAQAQYMRDYRKKRLSA